MFLAVQQDVFQPDRQLAQLLAELARLANNLHNQGVYESRQYFFEQGHKPFKVLKYVNLYIKLKDSENGNQLFGLFPSFGEQVAKSRYPL
ncbi:hypothetical protein H6F89_32330 [Cyanobacteria bacterium FACHB-63]|nr:hypothetical protein [Cyanobacteria bacterium FACHB-63]